MSEDTSKSVYELTTNNWQLVLINVPVRSSISEP